jgi:hypothetical protein
VEITGDLGDWRCGVSEFVHTETLCPVFESEVEALRRELRRNQIAGYIAIANMEAIIKGKDSQIRKLRREVKHGTNPLATPTSRLQRLLSNK